MFGDIDEELAFWESEGIEGALLWSRPTNEVRVTVYDSKRCEYFELTVPPGGNPLDVFHHPFAYAAHHRVERRALQPAA